MHNLPIISKNCLESERHYRVAGGGKQGEALNILLTPAVYNYEPWLII